jgi:hypothetical protein
MSTQGARAGKGWKAMRVTRIGKMFNHKGQKGVFDISRAKGYRDYVLRDPDDPNIPNTDVPRLRLVHLGGRSVGVSEDEIQRVVTGLEEWHASKVAQRAGKKTNPPHRDGAETARLCQWARDLIRLGT